MSLPRHLPFAFLLSLAFVALAFAVPPASAQTHSCGEIQLIFKNPDLQPAEDGFIHAQGQFFVQFQAIGADADKIAVFGFSFGPYTHDFDETSCGVPAGAPWVTGAYVPNYRADREAKDGFFIPVKTMLVPDGTYAAAVHAYDASNNELARFWARAVVENCDNQTVAAQEKCDANPAMLTAHDRTAPWPILLPGDGKDALEGHTFTVEFGEALSNYTVYLNGEDITAGMKEWDGRLWDADYAPDYGPGGASAAVAPPCTQQYHECEKYGPAYEWTGRPLTPADFIRVEAYDLAGNKAVKDVHIGSSVAGGAVSAEVPVLSVQAQTTKEQATPGGQATFTFRLANDGNGAAHPSADVALPTGWTANFDPPHTPVMPGESKEQRLHVQVGREAGTFQVNATFRYQAGAEQKVLTIPLEVTVAGAGATTSGPVTTSKESIVPPLAPLVLVGAALAWRRLRS